VHSFVELPSTKNCRLFQSCPKYKEWQNPVVMVKIVMRYLGDFFAVDVKISEIFLAKTHLKNYVITFLTFGIPTYSWYSYPSYSSHYQNCMYNLLKNRIVMAKFNGRYI
jgi:hypothetical protein